MIEHGDSPNFALEETRTFSGCFTVGIRSSLGSNYFDGYLTANVGIFANIDFSHTSASEEVLELITAKLNTFKQHGFHPISSKLEVISYRNLHVTIV